MKNLRLLVGMPVICGGRKLGRVVQAQVSEELTRMTGLFVDAGIKGTRFIPSSDVSVWAMWRCWYGRKGGAARARSAAIRAAHSRRMASTWARFAALA